MEKWSNVNMVGCQVYYFSLFVALLFFVSSSSQLLLLKGTVTPSQRHSHSFSKAVTPSQRHSHSFSKASHSFSKAQSLLLKVAVTPSQRHSHSFSKASHSFSKALTRKLLTCFKIFFVLLPNRVGSMCAAPRLPLPLPTLTISH